MKEEQVLNKMGVQPIGKLVAAMAMPAIFAMLIQALYNIVDSMFVARISEGALLSVSLAYPLQMLMISVAVGTGVGINSLISRRLGEGKIQEAGSAASHGIVLAIFSWVGFLILTLTIVGPYFRAFTQNALIYADGVAYTQIVLGGSLFALTSINAEKAIQATGNMMMPMVQNLAGAITNIILDPLLIFGVGPFPQMGVSGAAIATIIGQMVSMIIGLWVLFRQKHEFKATFRKFHLSGSMMRQIYQVGVPSIVMQGIVSVMTTGMNAILNPLATASVTVLGVYVKLQSFVFMPVFGLTQGALPILGYNFGARQKSRVIETYKVTCIAAFCIMLAGTIVFQVFPRQLLGLFQASDSMLAIGVPALRIISLSFIGAAFGIVNSTVFQALGHGISSLIVSVARQLFVLLPAAFILAKLSGLDLVWFAFPIAEVAAFIVSLILLIHIYQKQLKHMDSPSVG